MRPLILLAALLAGCKNAEEWRADADREVGEILAERQAELGVEEPFELERPAETLRTRLLAGLAEGRAELLTLDLVAALEVAAENSREWQDQRERLFRSALDLTLTRWDYAVQERGTLSAFLDGTGSTAESQGFLSNFNLFKLLGWGTRFTGDIGLDFLRDVGSGDGWDAVSHLSLNITQPILRGFGRSIVEEPLTQGERDVLYEARAYERFRRTFAVRIADSFFRVLEQVDRLENEEANFQNLVKLRERNEAFAEAGRLTDIQVDQARQDEFRARDRLISARRDLEGALDDFKLTLGLPIEVELALDEGGLRALEAWHGLRVDLEEHDVVALALLQRLDHLTVIDRLVDADRGVVVAADALRTGLDLGLSADLDSAEGRPLALHGDDIRWGLDLGLDLPIDRIPERNAYRRALIARDAAERDVERSIDTVRAELRDALRRLAAARASYEIQEGAVVLAERRIESAALNLEAGRASTRDLLEAQDDLLTAQNDLAANLTDTILAGLALYRDMELLDVGEQGILIDPDGLTAVPAQPSNEDPEP
jgi:outer membrane protein TolC